MSKFTEFLSRGKVADRRKEIVLTTADGIEQPFEISAVTQEEFDRYQRTCKSAVKKDSGLDAGKWNKTLVLNHVTQPELRSAELLAEAGMVTPDELLNAYFDPGTIAELASQITQFSGFDVDINEDIKTAKN